MSKASPILTSFNGGEVSPLMDGRVDFEKYPSSCREIKNYIPRVQGPVSRRPGFKHVNSVKDSSDRTWLIPFVFSSDQAFVLEFGDGYLRFFKDRARLVTGSVTAWSNATAYTVGSLASRLGVSYYCISAHTNQQPPNATYWYALTSDIYEVPTPWALADLTLSDGSCAIRYEQTGDVLRVIVPGYPMYKVNRNANTLWTVEEAALEQGPFLDENTTAVTMYSSAKTGNVTITASAATFASTDVGRFILLASKSLSDVRMWESGKACILGDERRVGNRVYECTDAGTTGTVTPIHTKGAAYDGEAASSCQWLFLHAGYGWAEITGFTSSTVVSATVVSDIPSDATLVANASENWELGRFSATTGHPQHLAFFRERLALAKDQVVNLSVAGDFDSFADRDSGGLVVDDQSITHEVGGGRANAIQWIAQSGRLIVGTTGGEFVVGEITTSDPLGPANIKNVPAGSNGSRAVRPVVIDGAVLHVQRAGNTVREAMWTDDSGYTSRNLCMLADHIGQGGIVQMDYQAELWSVVWCVRADGVLLGLTYDQENQVYGWSRHIVGGAFGSGDAVVESVACIPSPTNDRDDLWAIVKRTVNGSTVRYVEYLTEGYETGTDREDAIYLDSALTYDGAATTSITGLSHLEGQTVGVLADGAWHPDCTVSAGAITLTRSASVVQVGLAYSSRLKPMRLEAGAADGTSQGKTKRITKVVIRVFETLGMKFGASEAALDDVFWRTPSDPMGSAPAIFSGDLEPQAWPGGYESDGTIIIGQDLPFPSTIVAIMPQVVTQDR